MCAACSLQYWWPEQQKERERERAAAKSRSSLRELERVSFVCWQHELQAANTLTYRKRHTELMRRQLDTDTHSIAH